MAKRPEPNEANCDYIKKDGTQCRRLRGWGTDHPRQGRCKTHGGNSPSHIKAAARATVFAMAEEKDANPFEVLLKVIRLDWGAATYLQQKITTDYGDDPSVLEVAERTTKTGLTQEYLKKTEFALWQEIYGEWLDRAAKHSKLALDAGVAERQVRLAEQQGQLLAGVIRTILDGLSLTKIQQSKAPQLVRTALLALET